LKQYRIWDDQIRVNEVVIIKMNEKYQFFSTLGTKRQMNSSTSKKL